MNSSHDVIFAECLWLEQTHLLSWKKVRCGALSAYDHTARILGMLEKNVKSFADLALRKASIKGV